LGDCVEGNKNTESELASQAQQKIVSDSVAYWKSEIGRFPLLSEQDTIALFQVLRNGSPADGAQPRDVLVANT